jgi:hypothetical protein
VRLEARSTAPFVRCDSDGSGEVTLFDPIWTLQALFRRVPEPACRAAVDRNGDSEVNVTDAVYAIRHLFLAGPAAASAVPGVRAGSGAGARGLSVGFHAVSRVVKDRLGSPPLSLRRASSSARRSSA